MKLSQLTTPHSRTVVSHTMPSNMHFAIFSSHPFKIYDNFPATVKKQKQQQQQQTNHQTVQPHSSFKHTIQQ